MKRMCVLNSISKLSTVAMLVSTFALIGTAASVAGKKDTPQDVVSAGKSASAGLTDMQTALKDAQAIATRLQDPEVAARVLELAKRKDRKGLADLLKGEASSSQIRVKSVTDFTLILTILIGTKGYQLCISSTTDGCEHPSGAKGAVVFQESR